MEPLCPEGVRGPRAHEDRLQWGILQLADQIAHSSLVSDPRWKARALLAVEWAASSSLDLSPPRIASELEIAFEKLGRLSSAATRRSLRVIASLRSTRGSGDLSLATRVSSALLRRNPARIALDLVAAHVEHGRFERARELALERTGSPSEWGTTRRLAARMIASGVDEGAFVPRLECAADVERFVPSIALFDRLAAEGGSRARFDPEFAEVARRAAASFAGLARVEALVRLPAIEDAAGDGDRSLATLRSIPHESRRNRALATLIESRLARGLASSARKLLVSCMPPGTARDRAWLSLARALVRAGDLEAAGRAAAAVRQASFGADRQLLLVEIALAAGNVRSARERIRALPSALAETDPEAGSQAGILVARLALAGTPLVVLETALARIGRPHLPAARIATYVPATGAALANAARVLGALGGSTFAGAVVCERIVLSAHELATSNPGIPAWSQACGDISRDPLDRERALSDARLSATEVGWRRRRVLGRAARYALETGMRFPERVDRDAIRLRLASLEMLGGGVAAGTLEALLTEVRSDSGVFADAFRALAALDTARARSILLAAVSRRSRNESLAVDHLDALESRRAVEPGTADAWRLLADRAPDSEWIARFVGTYAARIGPFPPASVVRWAARSLSGGVHLPAPEGVVESILAESARQAVHPKALLEFYLADPAALERALALCPPALPSSERRWHVGEWRRALERVRRSLAGVEVDVGRVRAFAGRLRGKTRALVADLLTGAAPRGLGTIPWGLEVEGFRLQYLDKQRDFLSFLRLADSVFCCFHSASSLAYGRRWIPLLWRDPLSFAMHVERRQSGGIWTPEGFVFGSFALAERTRPAIVLNDVYLRRRRPAVRAAVLGAIAENFARPLGLARIGVAPQWRFGRLPDSYRRMPVEFERLRALTRGGSLVTEVYDDIGREVNVSCLVEHLCWRDLPRRPRLPLESESSRSLPGGSC